MTTTEHFEPHHQNSGFVIVLVLYILLAIILGASIL